MTLSDEPTWASDLEDTFERISHEAAYQLMTEPATAPAWKLGVELCQRQLDSVCALTRSEALAIADRHYARGDAWAASYWSGYVAAFVRYAGMPRREAVSVTRKAAAVTARQSAEVADALVTNLADVCNACGEYVPGGVDPSVMSAHDCDGEEQ